MINKSSILHISLGIFILTVLFSGILILTNHPGQAERIAIIAFVILAVTFLISLFNEKV